MSRTTSKHADRLDPDEYEVDSIYIENHGEVDEFAIFDARESTAHHAWVTALEDGFVDCREVR